MKRLMREAAERGEQGVIHGVGTDIVRVARIGDALTPPRCALSPSASWTPVRARRLPRRPIRPAFLAKRFAAKEAFGKALGTGVAAPATLHAMRRARRPGQAALRVFAGAGRLHAERGPQRPSQPVRRSDYVVAFAVIEKS
jgi:holo-[acyl-carrier protein] synthase